MASASGAGAAAASAMAAMMTNFRPNPLNTPIGQKIEQATDASLTAENWALNMEICDMINNHEETCKDAVRAISKRLHQNMGKNYTVVLYTLTVLETCAKNCGRRFRLLISQKDFIMDLVKLIGPKNDPPLAIQDRVLGLVQSWADAFQSVPDMQGVVQAYQDLKQKGIEFPMTDLDSMAPIITPQRSVTSSPSVPKPSDNPPEQAVIATAESVTSQSSNTPSLTAEQLAKLRSELDIVQCNMKVFGEMLSELTPGHEHPEDLQLLQELQKTLVAMQRRILELIDCVGVEEVTSELLHINDEMNNMFLRYERYEKKQKNVQHTSEVKQPFPVLPKEIHSPPPTLPPKTAAAAIAASPEEPLIDFGDSTEQVSGINAEMQEMKLGSGDKLEASSADVVDEFDMFAQSRNISYELNKTRGSSYADNTNLDHMNESLASYAQVKGQSNMKDDDVQNLSKWLDGKPTASSNDDFVLNPEFDRFLSERAAAAERLPDATRKSGDMPTAAIPHNSPSKRHADKDSAESSLFPL